MPLLTKNNGLPEAAKTPETNELVPGIFKAERIAYGADWRG
jgi:hypothetical protein